jgi:hypothetical protein
MKAIAGSVVLGLGLVVAVGCVPAPATTNAGQSGKPKAAAKPAVKHGEEGHVHGDDCEDQCTGWWCVEHGLPEEECSLCSAKAAKQFKARGDWCKEHDRARSQCFLCEPGLKEKYAALYRAKNDGQDPPAVKE